MQTVEPWMVLPLTWLLRASDPSSLAPKDRCRNRQRLPSPQVIQLIGVASFAASLPPVARGFDGDGCLSGIGAYCLRGRGVYLS